MMFFIVFLLSFLVLFCKLSDLMAKYEIIRGEKTHPIAFYSFY